MSSISIKVRQAVIALILIVLNGLGRLAEGLGRTAQRVAAPMIPPANGGDVVVQPRCTLMINGQAFEATDVQFSFDNGSSDDGAEEDDDREAVKPASKPPLPKPEPVGRYAGRGKPVTASGLLGSRIDPSLIPSDARSVKWEAGHLFSVFAPRPSRHAHGIHCPEPPLAAICPECDWRQSVIAIGEVRTCGYCGTIIAAYGTRLYWWFENETPSIAWQPKGGEGGR